MKKIEELDKIAISVKAHKLLKQLLKGNPKLEEIMQNAHNETEALVGIKNWVMEIIEAKPHALAYYKEEVSGQGALGKLGWEDYAAIRILDYIDNAGREFEDLNLRGEIAVSNPIKLIWLGVNFGTGGAKPAFFEDMLQLFEQLTGKSRRVLPSKELLEEWMERYPAGSDPRIIKLREENRDRIINVIIDKISIGEISDSKYKFDSNLSAEQKFLQVLGWWEESTFHLRFAIRSPGLLNEMLGYSLDPDTMKILYDAEKAGIPFFVNPYYLSLLHVRVPYFAIGADLAIRDYIIYSRKLIDEFGKIVAWEKEDQVEEGKPNAAGWILPSHHNVHRRYPEVAILIPDTVGRACGGLCASCQRMYDFQRGNLNFNLNKLKPTEKWPHKLKRLMDYYENDSQLRDILVTGGDALMSGDISLKKILDAIYDMAKRKSEKNLALPEGKKHAEIVRVRLGSRLPVYLPQRITEELASILKEFKLRASEIGIKQFVIQTHFESPMEVTPEALVGIKRLISSGWIITNQHVFTAAASRRGHNAKLRKVLNDAGVLTYYTFSVKGYMENNSNFVPNARAVMEESEEKVFGKVPGKFILSVKEFTNNPENMKANVEGLRRKAGLPFLSTDRNVLNLPGVGKSLTFRVIGITRYGRRILEFGHDGTRAHSPIISQMGKVVIIESKSIREFMRQLSAMGEDTSEYEALFGYSIGETEGRMPIYEYPEYDYELTEEFTNLEIPEVA